MTWNRLVVEQRRRLWWEMVHWRVGPKWVVPRGVVWNKHMVAWIVRYGGESGK